MKIDYDLESSPLQIKTDSEAGSEEKVSVWFYTAERIGPNFAGHVAINFTSNPQYRLWHCINSWTNFPNTLPTETDKVWTITLSRIAGDKLTIHCNDKEVLDIVLSSKTCNNGDWNNLNYWSRDVERIMFLSRHDTASDYYRPGKQLVCIFSFYYQ